RKRCLTERHSFVRPQSIHGCNTARVIVEAAGDGVEAWRDNRGRRRVHKRDSDADVRGRHRRTALRRLNWNHVKTEQRGSDVISSIRFASNSELELLRRWRI